MRIGPVAFLFLVVAGWALARAVVLWPRLLGAPDRIIAWSPPLKPDPVPLGLSPPSPFVSSEVGKRLLRSHTTSRLLWKRTEQGVEAPVVLSASFAPAVERAEAQRPSAVALALSASASRAPRFSISAWALIRSDMSPGLATAGQLGGSQVGIRARYRLFDRTHLAARISRPTGSSRGREASLALDLMPVDSLPVTVTIERRFALDKGGRSAFGIGMFGGFDRELLPRTRVDGYGQAGVVGLRSRDAYVDGAVRAERELASVGKLRIGGGAGLWGGAQPGASRLDAGPQIVAHAPLSSLSVRLGAEWRQRIAGDARPGSGPVLSLGADF